MKAVKVRAARTGKGESEVIEEAAQEETIELLDLLERGGMTADDPVKSPEVRSEDPDDDYLIALASSTQSVLTSGDPDLLNLSGRIPVRSPAEFLAVIEGT